MVLTKKIHIGLSVPGDAIKRSFGLFIQSVVRRWMSSDAQCDFWCISHWDLGYSYVGPRACERNGASKLPAQRLPHLHEAGLRGRLPCVIEGFLKNRQFSVRLGACLSGLFDQEMGVPQGSVRSVTLFALKNKLNSQSNFSWRRIFALCG